MIKVYIPEEKAWVISYKAVSSEQFVLDITENEDDAGWFDEDDYILYVCKKYKTTPNVVEKKPVVLDYPGWV